MGLRERIEEDLKQAMRARDELARETLRMVLAELKNKRIELGRDLGDEDEQGVLRRAAKTRQESVEQYEKAGRPELAAKERAEIAVVERYLPRTLDEEQTRAAVEAAIAELSLTSKKELGTLMKALMVRHKGALDGKLAQKLAGELLA